MKEARTKWRIVAVSLLFCIAGCGPGEPEQPPVPPPPPSLQ
jgi:hypothetical protein